MSTYAFDADAFINAVSGSELQPFAEPLAQAVDAQGHALKHGHLPQWQAAVSQLPETLPCSFEIIDGAVSIVFEDGAMDAVAIANLEQSLKQLMPWRKGPYQFSTIFIDTEWRSDWKWERLAPHISDLTGRTVLDVGCGSGYHLWRIRESGASCVLGIEPSLLYIKQFEAVQHFLQDSHVQVLPLPVEALPANMRLFDTVFSMGVLYHRRDPLEHLAQLMAAVKPGGELVLETLVVVEPDITDTDAEADISKSVALPDNAYSMKIEERYANMRNIYELPSTRLLSQWLEQAGFESVSVADVHPTSRAEQRSTLWMSSHSLAQALDPADLSKTVEGYPRPLRAIVTAQAPAS